MRRPLLTLLLACAVSAAAVNVTVLPGDTLPVLAARHGVTPLDLLLANPGLGPADLRPGLTVALPPGAPGPLPVAAPTPAPAGPPLPAAPVTASPPDVAASTTWTVRRGDTLSAIARRHGLSLPGLLALNPGVDPGRPLMVGRVLVVPALAAAASLPPVPGGGPDEAAVPGPTDGAPLWPAPGLPNLPAGPASPWVLPVSGGRLTTPFQPGHPGVDLAVPAGTPVHAAAAGVVVESSFDARSGWGWTVLLEHPGGWRTRYSHNSANLVQVGQQVQAGQLVARVGSTGNSTGPHVDYRVYVAGVAVDPLALPPGPSALR